MSYFGCTADDGLTAEWVNPDSSRIEVLRNHITAERVHVVCRALATGTV